jgi:hypothetical protein
MRRVADKHGRICGKWLTPCRRYRFSVTDLTTSQAFRTDPTQRWERDDMLKKVKKISLRVPLETACFAVKAWPVFQRENYFRQYIFYFAGAIKTGG